MSGRAYSPELGRLGVFRVKEIGRIVDEGAAEVVRFIGKWGNGGGHVMVGLTSRGATDATRDRHGEN